MVKIYVKRIRAGLMTIAEVPELWRDKVMEALKDNG